MATTEQLYEVERWFAARGTPHLMEGYSATEDVLTRMVPLLTLVAVAEAATALDTDSAWWQNLLVGAGGIAILLAAWVVANLARDRPALSRPSRVGAVEVITFVVAPALATYLLEADLGPALAIAGLNLGLLGSVYLVTSYGLVPLTRWALVKTARELGAVVGLIGRALPLLLLIQIVLFINTEMWQVADGFDGRFLAAAIVMFALIGITFLLTRLPRELDRLAVFASPDHLGECIAGTPAVGLVDVESCSLRPADLSRRQRGNVLLVALVSQGVQVVLVTLILGAFFVAFGLLTITPVVIESWIGHPADELFRFGLLGRDIRVTAELLKISAFLASFSGLYFTVVLVTDSTYREEFFDEILAELRQTFAVRAVYLCARDDPSRT